MFMLVSLRMKHPMCSAPPLLFLTRFADVFSTPLFLLMLPILLDSRVLQTCLQCVDL
jgi:hypothetical protein